MFSSSRLLPKAPCLSRLILPCIIFLLISLSIALRPSVAGADPKVVILEFHGLKAGIITESFEGLPNFREMILGQNNENAYVYMPKVLTTLPAASQPAVTSMYSGLHPKRTGVVSSIWFDRTTAKTNTLISYGQQRINRILEANGAKSLFDYFGDAGKHSMTSMMMLTNGADWSIKSGAFFWGNSSVTGFFRNGRWIPDARYVDRKTMQGFLTGHVTAYFKSLSGVSQLHGSIPDLMAVQLLGTDLFSHYPTRNPDKFNVSIDAVQKYYARMVLDPLMGELIQTLKRLGCYEDTIFLLVSEHGFTRIQKQVRNEIVDESLKQGFRLPSFKRGAREADAVIMPGAGTKEVYLKNRLSGDWTHPPRLIDDIKAAADLILQNPEIRTCTNTILIRQYPGERFEGAEENDLWWVFDWQTYLSGAQDRSRFLSCLRPLSELALRFESADYLALGLKNQYTRQTAPDIKLVTNKGFYFEGDFDKYAHHGSYYPDDYTVSFWVAGPGLGAIIPGRHVIEKAASTLDLVPIVTYLSGVAIPEGLDGNNPLADLPAIRSRGN